MDWVDAGLYLVFICSVVCAMADMQESLDTVSDDASDSVVSALQH
jgi:hypothetical protein